MEVSHSAEVILEDSIEWGMIVGEARKASAVCLVNGKE